MPFPRLEKVMPAGIAILVLANSIAAFEWSTSNGRPEVTRQALAGLWRLTNRQLPMKEFTVYPKKNHRDDKNAELLLMLNEDGSFRQYNDDESFDDVDLETSWQRYEERRKRFEQANLPGLARGIWDFRDGKLILAADRDDDNAATAAAAARMPSRTERRRTHMSSSSSTMCNVNEVRRSRDVDTLLEGHVVASYASSLPDNPVERSDHDDSPAGAADAAAEFNVTSTDATTTLTMPASMSQLFKKRPKSATAMMDAHLSVPLGAVKVGKFFYPKKHPSFFETPMFQPVLRGSVQLRQVLGTLNAKNDYDDDEPVEKFHVSDFYNRTFLLTSQPLRVKQPKGRWSIKYNCYVNEKTGRPIPTDEDSNGRATSLIRVLEIQFHANNTFSTVAGVGSDAILRGKFDVMGREHDQLWLRVSRFGFGRDVSGSVYSEGRALTADDAKTYWGTIMMVAASTNNVANVTAVNVDGSNSKAPNQQPRLEVTGSVLFGSGLEPMPVGRFIMREMQDESMRGVIIDDEDDEEEEVEEDGVRETLEDQFRQQSGHSSATNDPNRRLDHGIDWSAKSGFE